MRHGQTSWDSVNPKLNRINGWSSEGLDSRGQAQVEAQLPTLKQAGITGILASDLQRAKETAGIVSQVVDTPVVGEHGLRCWFLGMYAGQLEPVVKPLVDYFVKHPEVEVPYGESFNSFVSRLFYTLDKVEDFSIRHPEKCLLVVTHGSCIEYLIDRLAGIWPGEKVLSGFPPAGLYDMMFDGSRWIGKEHK